MICESNPSFLEDLMLSIGDSSQANKVRSLISPLPVVVVSPRNKYFSASILVLVFYDYALTFEDEVSSVSE